MPEGPSIIILKEATIDFVAKKVVAAEGTATIDYDRMIGKKIVAIKTWGKHFLVCFDTFTLRVHFLLFGSYMINERKKVPAKLSLFFADGEINLYACSLQYIEGDINAEYDWSADVMADEWNSRKAAKKLNAVPDMLACDALLDQDIFAGVGNIIKNEVLYRVKIHPESRVGALPQARITKMMAEARRYAFEFLELKKKNELKKHWLAYTKKICLRCDLPIIRKETGQKKRRSFYCENCQTLFT